MQSLRVFYVALAAFCLDAACIGHAADRTTTVIKAEPHRLSLEECVNKAIDEIQQGHPEQAQKDYEVCADAADADAGRK